MSPDVVDRVILGPDDPKSPTSLFFSNDLMVNGSSVLIPPVSVSS
jgi:hypothetical protein